VQNQQMALLARASMMKDPVIVAKLSKVWYDMSVIRTLGARHLNLFDPQIMRGMLVGFLIGIIVASIASIAGMAVSFTSLIFWGAVIGGFAAYWPRFAKLGAVITRKPGERNRNMLVGVLALVAFAVVIIVLVTAGGWLLTECFPSFR
jgi:hypothetical protein